MNLAKLHWADGRIEQRAIDAAIDTVLVQGPDGRYHTFRATDRTDEDGDDIYEEEIFGRR